MRPLMAQEAKVVGDLMGRVEAGIELSALKSYDGLEHLLPTSGSSRKLLWGTLT